MRFIIISIILLFGSYISLGQGCCSGGGGSPMAGGAATGVLQKGQVQVMSSYKYSKSDRFLIGDRDTLPFFENLQSNYLYFKTEYGLSDRLTLSISSGYYLNRTINEFPDTTFVGNEMEIEYNKVESSGIGDIIIFPRYNLFEKTNNNVKTELTLGLGMTIPLGLHNDSNFVGHSYFLNFDNPQNPYIDSLEIWQTSPPTIQATTGSNDLIFYSFYSKNYYKHNLRLFASALYIRKGWNSLGLRFGDYATVGLSAGTTLFNNLGLLGQLKGEWVGVMKTNDLIDVLSEYNIDKRSTGSRMLSFVPQVSYSFKQGVTVFSTADIPLYQYLNGTQVASEYQVTAGVSFRFMAKKDELDIAELDISLCKKDVFKVWGLCGMCKETIESALKSFNGVASASWDVETKMLEVFYNDLNISIDDIKVELARIGYDSETHKAKQRAYNNLHGCCKYDRN